MLPIKLKLKQTKDVLWIVLITLIRWDPDVISGLQSPPLPLLFPTFQPYSFIQSPTPAALYSPTAPLNINEITAILRKLGSPDQDRLSTLDIAKLLEVHS
ncbi:unnamed protein product [Gongylonema pulchrum]|uniref:HEME_HALOPEROXIDASE domain-containing protein n=1 Tax=Gongylonema pulchrum TaxID=637853 RepID=A0A183EBT7_9BILA|nr:unnamed protein product [Gongylonema pulchrum]